MTAHHIQAQDKSKSHGHFASVNGLKMYYEIHGSGQPLVLIHGGGSTINTTFGRVLPDFAKTHRVIAVELQAHGHTRDINRPLSFEQDADDVAALLEQLHIQKASFFGFSNGGNTAMQIAIRHPKMVDKLIIASAMFKRDAFYSGFWDGMQKAKLDNMPQALKDDYLSITSDPAGLQVMHDKDVQRMLTFKDWNPDAIRMIQAPSMVISGDADVVRPEHAVELYRLLPHAKLAIFPGGHGDYLGEITTLHTRSKVPALMVSMIEEFLMSSQ